MVTQSLEPGLHVTEPLIKCDKKSEIMQQFRDRYAAKYAVKVLKSQ